MRGAGVASPVSSEPSTAGSLADPSSCGMFPAATPTLSVATVPSPKVALAAVALASSTRVDPKAEIPCA